jgi:putative transposase
MIWVRLLAYITGTVDQELLLRNEYLAAENRILGAQIKGRLLLSDAEKARSCCTTRDKCSRLIVHIGSAWG